MEGRKYYKKLIRDRIPEKIASEGSDCETRTLTEQEFRIELRRKVPEEASAFTKVESRAELLSELADLDAVLNELCKLEGITPEERAQALSENMARKGGFDQRVYLEWSTDSGYKSNEETQ